MIIKIENPGMAIMLRDWFIEVEMSALSIALKIYRRMVSKPDDTLLCASVEDDEVKGVASAYVDGTDCVIWQMNGINAKQIYPPMFSWAKSRGCKRFVIHTNRNPKAFTRRHGFKLEETRGDSSPVKYTMSRSL
jgi:hypothetical protein